VNFFGKSDVGGEQKEDCPISSFFCEPFVAKIKTEIKFISVEPADNR
jgi:hypothetical protein